MEIAEYDYNIPTRAPFASSQMKKKTFDHYVDKKRIKTIFTYLAFMSTRKGEKSRNCYCTLQEGVWDF